MKKIKADNRGMTMAEVLVGFAILSIMLGMLSQIISFSSNLYRKSVDIKRMAETMEQYVYKKEIPLEGSGASATVKEIHENAGGSPVITDAAYEENGSKKTLSTKAKVYTVSSKDFPPVISAEEDPEIKVILFR